MYTNRRLEHRNTPVAIYFEEETGCQALFDSLTILSIVVARTLTQNKSLGL